MDDKALKRLVQAELDWDPAFDANDIGVAVENGIVSLTGYVATFGQKLDVEAAVKRVKGVRGYVEKLQIRPFAAPYSDESIATRVANVIDWDTRIPKNAVKAKVTNGHVTLTGHVNWQFQRQAAEEKVRPMPGVRALTSLIEVKAHVEVGDVKQKIEDALERQADLDADRIRVIVIGDTVRLEGKVRAWFERDLAEKAAWAAPGVKAVDDRITVDL
ncbi:Transport-associated [uncultured Defluviicoccus sp.]|uniref:Transport-associated n=1 Tax=metagenome TaxID=256318 RepID=A0A380T7J8_9ZZZZ|nr:Transport-associated [uncultured Defluviicoccus sp.]